MWKWSTIASLGGGSLGTAIPSIAFYALNATHPVGWGVIIATVIVSAVTTSSIGGYFGNKVDNENEEKKIKERELDIKDKEVEAALLNAKNEEDKNRVLTKAQKHNDNLLDSLNRELEKKKQIIEEGEQIKKGEKPMPEGEDEGSMDLKLKKAKAEEEFIQTQIRNAQATAAIIANAYKTPHEEFVKTIENKDKIDWIERSFQFSLIFLIVILIPFLILGLVKILDYYYKKWFSKKEISEEKEVFIKKSKEK